MYKGQLNYFKMKTHKMKMHVFLLILEKYQWPRCFLKASLHIQPHVQHRSVCFKYLKCSLCPDDGVKQTIITDGWAAIFPPTLWRMASKMTCGQDGSPPTSPPRRLRALRPAARADTAHVSEQVTRQASDVDSACFPTVTTQIFDCATDIDSVY